MLGKQQGNRGHQYPPWEGTQLLCGQESNTQKQRLKGEKKEREREKSGKEHSQMGGCRQQRDRVRRSTLVMGGVA